MTAWRQGGYFLSLARSVRAAPERTRARRDRKLARLLSLAETRVPWYRRAWGAAGLSAGDVRSTDDLRRLPLLSKSAIRADPLAFLRDDVRPEDCVAVRTSGSTGHPMQVHKSVPERLNDLQRMVRFYMENGYRPWRPIVGLWRQQEFPAGRALIQRLGFFDREIIDHRLPLDERLRRLARRRPGVLYSHKSNLRVVAEEALRRGLRLPRPDVLALGGEARDPRSEAVIAGVFGREPVHFWGAAELGGVVGWECERRAGFHLFDETFVVEVIREDGSACEAGETGRIVITALDGLTTPLIRYDIGDRGARRAGRCACGRTSAMLESVIGREEDELYFPDGTVLNLQHFHAILNEYRELRQFRIIQEETARVRALLACAPAHFPALRARFAAEGAALLPAGVRLDIENPEEIPVDDSGKLRTILSRVPRAAAR